MGLGKKKVHYRQVADALRVPLVIDQRLDESMRCDRRVPRGWGWGWGWCGFCVEVVWLLCGGGGGSGV